MAMKLPVCRVTICVRAGTPEQAAVGEWFKRWAWTLRQASPNHGCGCCVDIYFVEALTDVLAELPLEVIASDCHSNLDDLERVYCR